MEEKWISFDLMKEKDVEENNLPVLFEQSVELDKLSDFSAELVEVTVDSVMKDGVLKEIPIIGGLLGIYKAGTSVRDYLFMKKLLLFLHNSSKLSEKQRDKIIDKLNSVDYQVNAGERLLNILDKLEDSEKARILGKAIFVFGQGEINSATFWKVAYAIEKLPLEYLQELRYIENGTKFMDINAHMAQLYLNAGVGVTLIHKRTIGNYWLAEVFHPLRDKILEDY